MSGRRLPVPVVALLLSGAILGCLGCGRHEESGRLLGHRLTVYTSLPAHGVSAPAAAAVAAGQRLALADAGGRVARRRVRLVQLDTTRPGGRIWEPAQVSANAKRAADDPTTIAYLGELDYGASAVSLPITNKQGILQVSPGDGLTSLTRTPPGPARAGPERYYPNDERTFLRLVPNDLREAELLVGRLRASGATRPAVVSDEHIYGRELAGQVVARLRRARLEPVRTEELPADPEDSESVAHKLADARPNAVVYAGVAGTGTAPLLAWLSKLAPRVPVFASSGLLAREPPLRNAPDRVEGLTPVPPPARLTSQGKRLLRRVAKRYGAGAARSEAVYGYESLRLVLAAIRSAGPNRAGVVREALVPGERKSPLGRYLVRRTGDVDGQRFALYRLVGGRFRFERELR